MAAGTLGFIAEIAGPGKCDVPEDVVSVHSKSRNYVRPSFLFAIGPHGFELHLLHV